MNTAVAISEKKKIWILEDDQNINWIYNEVLNYEFDITFFTTIAELQLALCKPERPQLIISDLRLPDGNFINILKDSFATIEGTPFLVVSANADMEMLQFCLKGGAVDYLTKPFQVNELLVKIEIFLNKFYNEKNSNKSKLGKLNPAFINESLTYKESKILHMLMKSVDSFVPRKEILDTVWGNSEIPNPKTMDVHLYNLRRKIEPLGFHIVSDNQSRLQLT